MVSGKNVSKKNPIIEGTQGKYKVGNYINKGGNGNVYDVEIIETSNNDMLEKEYVIKKLTGKGESRYRRFKKEIESVNILSRSVKGIIPIIDWSLRSGDCWYIMPKAESYDYNSKTTLEIMIDMLNVAETIKKIHKYGYQHRDIKPSNLLFYKGELCLSDFGLVWNNKSDDNITQISENIGPILIRPNELKTIMTSSEIDFEKSDAYLFSKTLWMMLMKNKIGFTGEYHRDDDQIRLKKEVLDANMTLEPLHLLLDGCTKDEFYERKNINYAICNLKNEINIFKGSVSERQLNVWKYNEARHDAMYCAREDVRSFVAGEKIIMALQKLVGNVVVEINHSGKNINYGILERAIVQKENFFTLYCINNQKQYKLLCRINEIRFCSDDNCRAICCRVVNLDNNIPKILALNEMAILLDEMVLDMDCEICFKLQK